MTQETGLSERAAALADSQGFGAWHDTTRVNSHKESNWLANGVPILLVAGIGLGLLVVARDRVTGGDAPWWGVAFLAGLLLLVAGAGVVATLNGLRLRRLGHLLLHRFDSGFVIERAGGGQLSAPYERVSAELIDYTEPGDSTGSDREHLGLRLTFADDDVLMIAESEHGTPEALVAIAERCRRHSRRRLPYPEAVRLLHDGTWL